MRGHGERCLSAQLEILYEFGEGVPKNDSQAVAWYRKAKDEYDKCTCDNKGKRDKTYCADPGPAPSR
jgi:hypothetical protein